MNTPISTAEAMFWGAVSAIILTWMFG